MYGSVWTEAGPALETGKKASAGRPTLQPGAAHRDGNYQYTLSQDGMLEMFLKKVLTTPQIQTNTIAVMYFIKGSRVLFRDYFCTLFPQTEPTKATYGEILKHTSVFIITEEDIRRCVPNPCE